VCLPLRLFVGRALTYDRYEQYKEKKAETDAKYKAKKARQEHEDGEWEGIESDAELSDDGVAIEAESSEGEDSEGEDNESGPKKLTTHLDGRDAKGEDGLSKKAAMFFDQEIFQGIAFSDLGGEESEEEGEESEEEGEEDEGGKEGEEAGDGIEMEACPIGKPTNVQRDRSEAGTNDGFGAEEEEDEDTDIEIAKAQKDDSWDAEEEPIKNGKLGTSPFPARCTAPD